MNPEEEIAALKNQLMVAVEALELAKPYVEHRYREVALQIPQDHWHGPDSNCDVLCAFAVHLNGQLSSVETALRALSQTSQARSQELKREGAEEERARCVRLLDTYIKRFAPRPIVGWNAGYYQGMSEAIGLITGTHLDLKRAAELQALTKEEG